MLTTMRRIGNSRGVLIPAAFLASCQIEDHVDMQLQDGQIVIKPVRRQLREGWFADAVSRETISWDTFKNAFLE
jgi:antitoxin MazE